MNWEIPQSSPTDSNFQFCGRFLLTSAEGSGGLENARLSFVASCDVALNA